MFSPTCCEFLPEEVSWEVDLGVGERFIGEEEFAGEEKIAGKVFQCESCVLCHHAADRYVAHLLSRFARLTTFLLQGNGTGKMEDDRRSIDNLAAKSSEMFFKCAVQMPKK